ncbi:hypothetical protein HIM_04287 [Hirsutella minnesotensis 3608]|uniref:UDP-glucose:glycoprotein glucosyltransferase n=1 Tax=Hirsutella minnesotensis 3608 TaxID=1043627 RepID=A0A0F7ZPW4_9HYPO|nr:hypothetical protein HIM_04287 [Hirsutella minnesotensis 3608]
MMHSPSMSLALGAIILTALPVHALPSVTMGMNAAFSAGPYLLELLETAAAENETAYFPLLDRLASGYFDPASSDADLYGKFVEVLEKDGHVSSPEALSTFNLALSLRSAAPRIEAHYQYYDTAVKPLIAASECQTWVLLEGKQYCNPKLDGSRKEGLPLIDKSVLPFDRTWGSGKEVVLYADPTAKDFGDFHNVLYKAALDRRMKYRLRYRRSQTTTKQHLPVSGYGVELALKRTDYIVIDDREGSKESSQKPLSSAEVLDGEEEVADLRPLSTSELASLGMKTASFIQKSDKPFETLVKLMQDFPRYSASIASHNVSDDFQSSHEKNQLRTVPGGVNFLLMNGVQLIERQIEPFALVEMLRRERKLLNGVRDLGLDGKQAVSLLGHKAISTAKDDDEPLRYDWTDKAEDGKAILWLNDLEKDARYEGYPKSLTSLLQRVYPGQLPPIALNVFNFIIPIDFSDKSDLEFLIQIAPLVSRGIPIRFGLVPLASTDEATARAKVAHHLMETYGFEALVSYLDSLDQDSQVVIDDKLLNRITADLELLSDTKKLSINEISTAEVLEQRIKSAQHWVSRLKADTRPKPFFVNGIATLRDKSWMQTMGMRVSEDLQTVQQAIFDGSLNEDTWIPGIFLKQAASRRNVYIALDNDKALRMLDVSRCYTDHAKLFRSVPVLEPFSESTKENWAVATIIADLATDDGLQLALAALEFKRNNPGIRLELIHNPEEISTATDFVAAIKASEDKLGDIETAEQFNLLLDNAAKAGIDEDYAAVLTAFLKMGKISAGTKTIVLNGRIVGPLPGNESFTTDDFQQLLDFEQTRRILPVYAALDDMGLSDKLSDAVAAAKATSITALSTISDLPEGIFESAPALRSTMYEKWNMSHSTIELGDPQKANIHIAGLLDPVSEKGQRWVPILKVLSELEGVYLKLVLNPREKIDELPIKRFFRYVMKSKPSFDESGKVEALRASFKNLPSEALLTAGMDVPPAWLVAPKESMHDLDNVKLSTVTSDVEATYELEHILIEGHSREDRGKAPRGAQLALATEKDPMVTDTTIMSNLGFFQFKANPGFYNIKLKEGRTAEMYTIESIGAQGFEAVPGDEGTELALMNFQGATLYPRLKRRPGMEDQDVLKKTDDASGDSLVSKGLKFAGGFLGGSKDKPSSALEHAEINIFSVASGHLYERMLNIMMVSVMKNTKHTVKFWFIEQFLSPSFKEFIPHMAKEYGFNYEMVTYKWPHWLRQQKEKQREIWGYKILFLDVLFPLSLDKVIFVDADQIVRTDMMDLVNLDLKGAPYGFTPMCDSRVEMEGFRFWKQGYWATYLRGKPYHISALYVVDLRRFRELAAGDRLRQQYHALSADPNSLSNLDQDLPNHMQFEIPIHSLPQEWLWCETWCSDESQAAARTIDLCNNPQTKEPKLDRARRQVPEWTLYDDEIAALDRRVRGAKPRSGTGGEPDHAQSVASEEKDHQAQRATSKKASETESHSKDEL